MPEFKPCPFCGGADVDLAEKDDFDFLERKYGKASIYIRCRSCEVEMWEHTFSENDYAARLRLLTEKWNRRTIT